MLIDSLIKGGRERRLLELLKGFSKNDDVQVALVLFSKKVEYKEVFDLGIPVYFLERRPKKDPRVFFRFYKICRKEKPDIIHSWGIMPSIYAIPSAKLLSIKLVNACIADAPDDMNIFDKRYFRANLTFPFSDIVVGNSRAGLKAYHVPLKKGYCVYNGFDFNRIGQLKDKETIRAKYRIKTKKVVGMVGAFYDRKDYDTYIKGACLIAEQHKDVTFLALGNGPNLRHYQSMVSEKFRDRILFPGLVHDVESVVNLFDIGVLTSFSEGISNSIMEYMVLGKPVIATDGGGTKELVRDGKTGFLIPPKDPAALTGKLEILIGDPELGKKMGAEGKKRIQNQFSLERMEKDYLELYHNLRPQKIAQPV